MRSLLYGVLFGLYMKNQFSDLGVGVVDECVLCEEDVRLAFVLEILCCRVRIGADTRAAENRMAEGLYASDPQRLQKEVLNIWSFVSFCDTGIERFTIN